MKYKPSPFNVPVLVLLAEKEKVHGVVTKKYIEYDTIFVSAKSYGGTEKVINGQYVLEDTIVIECWYYSWIKSDSRLRFSDGSEWEIMNTPENIAMMNKYLRFKVRRVKSE